MQLADEFFLLALDDRTGRSALSPRVLRLGLAGALLGELILAEKIKIQNDRLHVTDHRPPPDPLTHQVLDSLIAELAHHTVRTWLVFLAQQARAQVTQRLQQSGHLRERVVRRLWRSEVIHPPTDPNAAATPRARLAHTLSQRRPLDWPDVTLAGLAVATGLDGYVLYTAEPSARVYLRHLIDHLPPSIHELVWHVHAAVGDAVLTGRT